MNLEDVIDAEYGLQQDEWSLTKPRFGKENQLEVIGWSGRYKSAKYYILKCDICSKDSELFGDGYFKNLKDNLNKGRIPCGCSQATRWTDDQLIIKINRCLDDTSSKLVCLEDYSTRSKIKCTIYCENHGMYSGIWVTSILHSGKTCPTCGYEDGAIKRCPSDEDVIASFLETDSFPEDTKFWKSNRTTSQGFYSYWFVNCPDCGVTAEAYVSDLRKGSKPCGCSPYKKQRQGYINAIVDKNKNNIAIKFGIANRAINRISRQRSSSIYEVINHSIWIFPSPEDCKSAEKECKDTLETSVLAKEEFQDGYTETTYVNNLDKIINIYKLFGGVLVGPTELKQIT